MAWYRTVLSELRFFLLQGPEQKDASWKVKDSRDN